MAAGSMALPFTREITVADFLAQLASRSYLAALACRVTAIRAARA